MGAVRSLTTEWQGLGLTPTSFSAGLFPPCIHGTVFPILTSLFFSGLLAFAYLAQCRCDPARTPFYFTYLTEIVKQFQEYGDCPSELQELLVMEQSRDRFTLSDVQTAAITLGFGSDNALRLDYEEEIPDEFVENAWKDCIKRSWRNVEHGYETQKHANDSIRILAEFRGSTMLRRAWEDGKNKYMNPSRAFDTLEVPDTVDDHMLIRVYNMRVCWQDSSHLQKLRLLNRSRKHQCNLKKCGKLCLSLRKFGIVTVFGNLFRLGWTVRSLTYFIIFASLTYAPISW